MYTHYNAFISYFFDRLQFWFLRHFEKTEIIINKLWAICVKHNIAEV